MAFNLYPNQREHVAALEEILTRSPFAFDFSMLGTGKTYTSTQIAMDMRMSHVVVIAPVSVLPKWRAMQRDFGLPLSASAATGARLPTSLSTDFSSVPTRAIRRLSVRALRCTTWRTRDFSSLSTRSRTSRTTAPSSMLSRS